MQWCGSERLLLNHKKHRDSWPLEEKNSVQGQKQGLIAESFCVKVLLKCKEIESTSDIDIRRGMENDPPLVLARELYTFYLVITMNQKNVWRL